jgi:hypothetical protein
MLIEYCYVFATVLGAWDAAVNKTNILQRLYGNYAVVLVLIISTEGWEFDT